MHPTKVILAIAAFTGYVAAQSSQWTVDASCDAANVVQACLDLISPRVAACTAGGNDYGCLCTQYTDLATCYNNCPNDPMVSSMKNTVGSYCAAYSATASTSSVATATATGSSTRSSAGTSTGSGATATTTGDGSSAATSSSSSATSTSTNAAIAVTPGYSYGAVAGLLAFAGAFL